MEDRQPGNKQTPVCLYQSMIYACVDVSYTKNSAHAACLLFDAWQTAVPQKEYQKDIKNVAQYTSGQFYKRELPCILTILADIEKLPDVIVIDGYVWLDEKQKPGLGAYLHQALNGQASVIGVAKNPFKGANHAQKVYRGKSQKPLYITAVGIAVNEAAAYVEMMHGKYRIPTLLKLVDKKSRKA